MVLSDWYQCPRGERLVLQTAPRLASWNKATHPDQVSLREYLQHAESLVIPARPASGPWALWLDVAVLDDRNLRGAADLDNYALPLATRVQDHRLVSVWVSKGHGLESSIVAAPARRTTPPAVLYPVHTTASAEKVDYKEQVRGAVTHASELPDGPVHLQIAFTVGPRRNWLNLWKPTIDALDPLLGRTDPSRLWHPKDGRVVELGLHVTTDPNLRNDVLLWVAARPAVQAPHQMGKGRPGPCH